MVPLHLPWDRGEVLGDLGPSTLGDHGPRGPARLCESEANLPPIVGIGPSSHEALANQPIHHPGCGRAR